MKPYGCHNRTIKEGYYAPIRLFKSDGSFTTGCKFIPHTMSTDCRYDHRATDGRCDGCIHVNVLAS